MPKSDSSAEKKRLKRTRRLRNARVARQSIFYKNYGAIIAGKILDKVENYIPGWMDVVLIDAFGSDVSPKKRAKFGAKVIKKFLQPWAQDLNGLLLSEADKRVGRLAKKLKS